MMDHSTLAPIGVTVSSMGAEAEAVMTSSGRQINIVNLTKMLVCLLVIVSLLLTMVVPVHAIALTTGIAIATVGALVLAACGVILTAPTGQSLTDYIGDQIDNFASTLGFSNRTTWLNGVTQQTVTSTSIWSILDGAVKIPGGIYNALSTWAGSYIEDNSIVSGGDPVGQVPISTEIQYVTGSNTVLSGNVTASWTSSNTLHITTPSGTWKSGQYNHNFSVAFASSVLQFPLNGTINWITTTGYSISNITIGGGPNAGSQNSYQYIMNNQSYDNSFTNYASPSYNNYLTIKFNGNSSYSSNTAFGPTEFYITFSGAQAQQPGGTVITPTATVVEPLDAAMGQDVIISGLPVTSSMTPEAAADAIQDQATMSAGLTATPALDGEAVPEGSGWLYNAIQAVGEFIVDGIGGLFIPSEGFWDVYVDNISDLFDDRMGLLTYPISVVADLFGRVADLEDVEPVLRWNDVVWKGQVVIPGGSYNLNDILEEDSMETIYGIYRIVVSGIMVIALIHLFIKKLEEIETK